MDAVTGIRARLAAAADPARAPAMQAYMKSAMPYRGVQMPEVRRACREVFRAAPPATFEAWTAAVLVLWRDAQYREERYAALELSGDRRFVALLPALPMYEEMVVTGAWWDYVDVLAIHRVGAVLRAHPAEMTPVIRAWSTDGDLWKRRTAVLSQTRFKADTDVALLTDCIEVNLADRDFFIRKAIGWALRSHAWTDPGMVTAFVEAHPGLSPLSRREALKNVTKRNGAG